MASDENQNRALDRLNATERDLLALLGRGHTAKSIATLRLMSEAAVNERFRSGRRKTGIGSSREIARLIVAQENRHDFIDLARDPARPSELQRPDTLRRASPPRRWRLLMAAAFLLATAIFAQQTSVPPAPSVTHAAIPAAAEAVFAPHEPSPDVVALHAEIAAGPTDSAWSSATGTALSRAYHRMTDPSGAVESFDVTCNGSLCEVLGVSRPGLTPDETNALMEALQARDLHQITTALNLKLVVHSSNQSRDDSAADNPSKVVFVSYWRRRD